MKNAISVLIISASLFTVVDQSSIKASTKPTTQKEEITKEVDPTLILGALSGALNAVSDRTKEKNPDRIHPISVIATILDQTNKLVKQQVDDRERKRSFTSEEITEPLMSFLSTLDVEYQRSKAMKKITKHALLLQSYFEKTDEEKEEYLSTLHNDAVIQKKMLGEMLFAAGNFIAEKTQDTAQICAENLIEVLSNKKSFFISSDKENGAETTKTMHSSEAQLLDLVGALLVEKNEKHKGEVVEVVVVDHLVKILILVKEILLKEPNLLYFWQETPMMGSLIKAASEAECRTLIAGYLETEEGKTGFVQELVYCIYHIVFDRLGQMLTIAYNMVEVNAVEDDQNEAMYAFEEITAAAA